MASWSKEYIYVTEYNWASRNQHGDRFKRKGTKQLSCCVISADITNAVDLRQLILLSDQLDAPVRYDFETQPQVAYIKVVSTEKIQEVI